MSGLAGLSGLGSGSAFGDFSSLTPSISSGDSTDPTGGSLAGLSDTFKAQFQTALTSQSLQNPQESLPEGSRLSLGATDATERIPFNEHVFEALGMAIDASDTDKTKTLNTGQVTLFLAYVSYSATLATHSPVGDVASFSLLKKMIHRLRILAEKYGSEEATDELVKIHSHLGENHQLKKELTALFKGWIEAFKAGESLPLTNLPASEDPKAVTKDIQVYLFLAFIQYDKSDELTTELASIKGMDEAVAEKLDVQSRASDPTSKEDTLLRTGIFTDPAVVTSAESVSSATLSAPAAS